MADRKIRGTGATAIAAYVRENYPQIAKEASEHYTRIDQERMQAMRKRKRQKEVDGIQKQMEELRQRLAALDVTEPTAGKDPWSHLIPV